MPVNFRSALNRGLQQQGLRPPVWYFTATQRQWWQATLRVDPYPLVTSCLCFSKAAAKENACEQFLQAHPELSQPSERVVESTPWSRILNGPPEGFVHLVRQRFLELDLEAVLTGPGYISVDCEGVITESGRIQLALLSLFDGEQAWVLGMQACTEARDLLARVFSNEGTIKVFCDYGADRRMLSPLFTEIVNTKDIQCMKLEGWESPVYNNRRSLLSIWEKCTGNEGKYFKDKKLTVSAWDSAQLSEEQLRYAIANVFATYQCYEVRTSPIHCSVESRSFA
ncbi:hypothetical protein CYMTET_2782 [Cymbomonas tetramitiformis]|uniref:3'-5' exonuclease domain-containing protein n=1 Tax=Cymbomonas tetramitiformis TaxID=36881 RepID=A0AAE0H4K7_9CHLO|nr:hypothetical protein CYMTET_2782 [Cymbomonas tetramitiformis]